MNKSGGYKWKWTVSILFICLFCFVCLLKNILHKPLSHSDHVLSISNEASVCEIHTDKLAGGNTQIQDTVWTHNTGGACWWHHLNIHHHPVALGKAEPSNKKAFITADILLRVKTGSHSLPEVWSIWNRPEIRHAFFKNVTLNPIKVYFASSGNEEGLSLESSAKVWRGQKLSSLSPPYIPQHLSPSLLSFTSRECLIDCF